MSRTPLPRRVAVVGSGVAGLTAAYALARHDHVTLFEADSRLGGHADTHLVDGHAVDTGFIVHNERTYPTLLRLFAELGVETQPSEMSMSVRCDAVGLEYAGALGLAGLFPTPWHALRPAYLRMLTEIPRFHRRARALLASAGPAPAGRAPAGRAQSRPEPTPDGPAPDGPAPDGRAQSRPDQTLRDFLDEGGFSPLFRTHFMESLVACVWSCDPAVALDYPARYLFTFLQHHGMLQVFGSPQWRTVSGGSRTYVERVAAHLDEILLDTKVTSLAIDEGADGFTDGGVRITDDNGVVRRFDAVVVATHPDQALGLLAAPTSEQRDVLSALAYSPNTATLHTDESVLPRAARARASWNYLRRPGTAGVTVTYDMTRLQRLDTETRYLVTLGGRDLIDPESVIETMEYAHPIYTPASVAAQRRLPGLESDRLAFAGAYHGWGFHEDGARSGLAAAERLGADWSRPAGAPPVRRTPTLYATRLTHVRRKPFRRTFAHDTTLWLVDLDHLPRRTLLGGSFEARDHLGDPSASLRTNVEAFLDLHGIELRGGRILLAANARSLGYCFNPISVFWCFDDAGALAGVIVEVHNTYGDRHAYLLHPDEQGRARTDKAMYVSPFHGTDGHYEIAVPVPGERLHIAVALHTDDGAVFSAATTGTVSTAAPWRTAAAALRGSALIRAHGLWLWARRLPIRPRPTHPPQGGVQ